MMLHKVGLPTFYGQAFLPDVCELGPAMLPYTERYFAELLRTGTIREVTPSDVWYESRTDFSLADWHCSRHTPRRRFPAFAGQPGILWGNSRRLH